MLLKSSEVRQIETFKNQRKTCGSCRLSTGSSWNIGIQIRRNFLKILICKKKTSWRFAPTSPCRGGRGRLRRHVRGTRRAASQFLLGDDHRRPLLPAGRGARLADPALTALFALRSNAPRRRHRLRQHPGTDRVPGGRTRSATAGEMRDGLISK